MRKKITPVSLRCYNAVFDWAKSQNVSAPRLAELLGVSTPVVYAWQSLLDDGGSRALHTGTASKLMRFCRAYNLPVNHEAV